MNIIYHGHNAPNVLQTKFGNMLNRMDIRQAIFDFEKLLLSLPGAQTSDIPTIHHLAPGSYARELHIPEGVVIVGKLHRHAHINVISKGKITVVTEHKGVEVFEAPITFISEPGTKRVVLASKETVWTTIHPTDLTDLAEIEKSIIADSFNELEIEL